MTCSNIRGRPPGEVTFCFVARPKLKCTARLGYCFLLVYRTTLSDTGVFSLFIFSSCCCSGPPSAAVSPESMCVPPLQQVLLVFTPSSSAGARYHLLSVSVRSPTTTTTINHHDHYAAPGHGPRGPACLPAWCLFAFFKLLTLGRPRVLHY